MLIIGLTGSIGMGKSTAATRFRAHSIGVFDADAEVHRLYLGPIAPEVERTFPGTVVEGKVDRSKLFAQLIAAPEKFRDLEAIVHPRVFEAERQFLQAEHARGAAMAVLEVPLLFELGREECVDATVLVSASAEAQRQRVLARGEMTEAKFEAIVARQLPEHEKRERADFVVETAGTVESCNRQIDQLIGKLRALSAVAFERYWRD
jgi:dephospho-CoA kinase